MTDKHEANRRRWNEVTPVHAKSKFYDVEAFLSGNITIPKHEIAAVGPVQGLKLLHTQCHFGLDTLSWARLGATVVGIDFSEEAISQAWRLARQSGLQDRAAFVCADVLDLDRAIADDFDIVYTSHGTVTWLSEIDCWGRAMKSRMKPAGLFYMCDDHPAGLVFEETDGELRLVCDYFHSDQPLELRSDKDYAAPGYTVHSPGYAWIWSLSDILSSLERQGLTVYQLREWPSNVYQQFPSMRQGDDGLWHLRPTHPSIPLMFEIKANQRQG